jgi:ATP-dependent protease HslVU (ClpYQ) peptidase subunit
MTAIAAVVDGGKVYIGGDSCVTEGGSHDVFTRVHPKVWVNDNFIFGTCGSVRTGQIVRYRLALPLRDPKIDLDKYICIYVSDAIRSVLDSSGAKLIRSDKLEYQDGMFLIGSEGRLWRMWGDFSTQEIDIGYDAIGSGGPFALGALSVTIAPPDERIKIALTAAEKFNAGVRGPFTVLSL